MPQYEHSDLRRIFDQALALPASERAAFLDSACGDNRSLREAVEKLLAGHDSAGSFLESPTIKDIHDSEETISLNQETMQMTRPIREAPGAEIGPYKLLQVIGEGGFGLVFLAEQREPVKRRVALKVIKLGMDTKQVIARFEAERQALAMMDHPNIARVFDGGATATGRPYFVMELVKGEPITDFCDRHSFSIRQRLELFEQVCTAVQHAHIKGIIHRDIKPSNVLVSMQDDRPVAKVIDFGIAKATNAQLTEKTFFTEHKQMIGTPQYMSPEQAAGDPNIDTRSDVYSLGVLLYELLTGTTPFDARRLRSAAFKEIQRIICEVEPPKPSTRLSETLDTLPSVAARRATEPKRLGTIIRGELDCIVMKALEKVRERRYESATSMAADIRRYLVGQPVLAAPPSAMYRLRKFVRRNRAAVVVAAAIVISIVIAGVSIVRARMKDLEIAYLQLERDKNRERQAENDLFFGVVFGSVQEETLALELVRQSEPAVRSSSLLTLGTYEDRKISHALTNGVDVLTSRNWDQIPHERLTNVLTICAQLLIRLDKGIEAGRAADRAITILRQRGVTEDHTLISSLNILASSQQSKRDYVNAESNFREALAICRRIYSGDHPDTAEVTSNLALLYQAQVRHDEAEPLFRESLAMYERLYPQGHADVATAVKNLASLKYAKEQLDEAERLFTQASDMRRSIYRDDHALLAMSFFNLAAVRLELGRAADAENVAREAYEMCKRHPDWRSDVRRDACATYFEVLKALGRTDEAMQVIIDFDPPVAKELPDTNRASLLAVYASKLLSLRRSDASAAAVPMLDECAAIRRAAWPDGHERAWLVYNAISLLGEAYLGEVGVFAIESGGNSKSEPSKSGKTGDPTPAFNRAEPLLLSAWEYLRSNTDVPSEKQIKDIRRREALARVVLLYDAWSAAQPTADRMATAAMWRDRLAEFDSSLEK
ncbi:MAG: serine/threonine protein kinase [Phycisphaerae bacterium]|nr:serine/threonine protein kinase [Phycisphaerae bacterium]